jgi:hypothetical protein
VQPPVLAVIGERFVTGVNDRAVKLNPLVNVINDVVCPLADLERHVPRTVRHFEIKRQRVCLADPARPGKDLAGRQEGQQ